MLGCVHRGSGTLRLELGIAIVGAAHGVVLRCPRGGTERGLRENEATDGNRFEGGLAVGTPETR